MSIIDHLQPSIDLKGREILLVFPGKYKAQNPQIPLSLLHLAAFLLREGYLVRLLDMRVERYNDSSIKDKLFIGISSMSGQQIRYGLEFAKRVREVDQSLKIVWGGVHPTLLPVQTVSNPYVDIVVRGEGEKTIVDLANKIVEGGGLEDVQGITFTKGKNVISNPDRQPIDLDDIPIMLPYKLIKEDKYPSLSAGRFHVQTSRGCPHRCGFCYNSIFNHSRWRSKSTERILDEFEYISETRPNIQCIDIIDDNFFVSSKRVEEICEGILARGIDKSWRADCRFDYMSRYNDDFLTLLEKSRCVELNFGAETGSKRLLSLINKDVTPEMMYDSVEKLKKNAPTIEPYVFWMSGLPTETEDDLKETYTVMEKLSTINPKTQHVEICIYTPFPSPMLQEFASQYNLPKTLEEWGKIDVFHYRPPWHDKKYVNMLESISTVTKFTFYPEARIRELKQPYRAAYKVMHWLAEKRWKHKYFDLPIDLKLASLATRKLRGY